MKSNQQIYSKLFYSEATMKTAIRDYGRIATIILHDNRDNYLCTFCDCVVDTKRVMHEFGNYLIELMNTQGEKT